jgi:low temperature requirement protein LtrA
VTSGTGDLFRKLEDSTRATFLELFFDVVFVFALRALTQLLLDKLTWSGAYQTLVLLLAIVFVWATTARVTERLEPQRPPVQLLVLATMVGALVGSAALPEAFGKTGLIFAATYLAIQIGRNLFLMFLLRGQEDRHVPQRSVIWYAATGVPWVIGALASGTVRTALWTLAVVLIYLGRWFNYPLPGLRRLAGGQVPAVGEYLAERYRALFIIGLGEVVLGLGSTLTSHGFATTQTVAFVVAFAVIALIWRIYIFRAGADIGPAIQASARPEAIANLASYAHIIMIGGLVVTSVGDALVIEHPLGHPRTAETVTILGGPTLFLAGRYLLAYLVFTRPDRGRIIGLIAVVCLVPPMLFVPPLVVTIAAGAVLAGVVIADNVRIGNRTISPPGPHRPSNQ